MPGQVFGGAQGQVDSCGTADDTDGFERVGGFHRTPGTPGARRFAQAGQHRSDVLGLVRKRGIQHGDLVVGGPAVVRDALDRAGVTGGLDHLRDREQRGVDGAAGDVAAQRLQQSGQQRGGQVRTVGFQRVEHRGGAPTRVVVVQTPLVEDARRQERRRQDLDESAQRQRFPDGSAALLAGGQAPAGRGGGQHRGDRVEPFEAHDLLDQVGGLTDVGPPARRRRGEPVAVDADRRADLCQPFLGGAGRIVDSGGAVGQIQPHADRRMRPVLGRRLASPVGQARLDGAAGDVGEQCGAPVQRGDRHRGVDRALVATTRLAVQVQPTLRARHRSRIPHRRLEQHIGGGVADLGGPRTHHATDSGRGGVVDDQHVGGIQGAFDVVERDHRLTRFGETHPEATADEATVVRVHRMPQFEHHVVRHVHGRRDRPDPGQQQTALHPPRRHRMRVDAGHRPQPETLHARARVDGHRQRLALGGQGGHHRGVDVIEVVGVGDLAGHPSNGQAVAAVGRDRQMEHDVVEPQHVGGRGTRFGGAGRQHQNPGVIGAEVEFGSRADHAVGGAPVGLSRGNMEVTGQHRSGQGRDHEVPDREIGCPADDVT